VKNTSAHTEHRPSRNESQNNTLDPDFSKQERKQPVVMAGKITFNRLEHCPETLINRVESRYHRIGHEAE
jgi:hypothetical protein